VFVTHPTVYETEISSNLQQAAASEIVQNAPCCFQRCIDWRAVVVHRQIPEQRGCLSEEREVEPRQRRQPLPPFRRQQPKAELDCGDEALCTKANILYARPTGLRMAARCETHLPRHARWFSVRCGRTDAN
jgi:hypothetical protein